VIPAVDAADTPFGPWNPGLESRIPSDLRHLSTIFRPENSFTSIAKADEMHDLSGLAVADLVAFRPQRLALHEVLIRVTADFSVPDGSKIEDLGINFRRIARTILTAYVEPAMGDIERRYDALRREIASVLDSELTRLFAPPTSSSGRAGKRGWSLRGNAAPAADGGQPHERALVAQWEAEARGADDPVRRAALRALAKAVFALLVRHGRVWGGRELVASLATDLACNDCGCDEIGRLIEPLMLEAAERGGYRVLPRQETPLVMNSKGASASGKSTLRPLQKSLAGVIGVNWSDFALISPDIWRKQLLDYASLGPAYKYAASFTGDEIRIVDQKLDRYMARKAERGSMSHLLIDRFRFDSFAPHSDEAGSNLLTRFGRIVYLFFMITPPDSLVERAWNRGLEFGRYKAVDDTLAHAVEAYSGMPELFFTWVARKDKRVHFEFLDNSVKLGQRPRTVAFGWNDVLNVLDVNCLLDVERFQRVNLDAKAPDALYEDRTQLEPQRNAEFLKRCIQSFRQVNFAEQLTGAVYLRVQAGVPVWVDRQVLSKAMADDDSRTGLKSALPQPLIDGIPSADSPMLLRDIIGSTPIHTLGAWGGAGEVPF